MISDLKMVLQDLEEDLNSCWLAATCPHFFLEPKSRSKINEIILLNICTNMEKLIRINLTSNHKHVSLRVAIMLLFGTIRVFQHQVQLLYDNIQFLVARPAIQWNESCKVPKERRGIQFDSTSTSEKKTRMSNIFSLDILSQLSSILELNDEEKKILNTEETPSQSNKLCLQDKSPPADFRVDHLNSEDFDGFGDYSTEDFNHFLNSNLAASQRNNDDCSDGNSVCTEIFQAPRDCKFIIGSSGKTTPRKKRINSTDDDISEQHFRENILISSTPLSACSFTKRPRMDFSEEILKSPNSTSPQYPQRRLKRKRSLKLDGHIKIKEKKFVNQFDYASTLRHIAAHEDVVPLFEMKKVNSKDLMSAQCNRRVTSQILAPSFKRNLVVRKLDSDPSILEEILGKCDLDYVSNVYPKTRVGKKRLFGPNVGNTPPIGPNHTGCQETTEPASKMPRSKTLAEEVKIDSEPYIIIEKVKRETNSMWRSENSFQLQERHERMLKFLNILWQEQICPINMKTINSHKSNRKEIALTFLTIIELSAKGCIEIIKDSITNEISHIAKKIQCRKTA